MRDRSILDPAFEQHVIPRDFKKNPIKKNGVHGVATNDADYVISVKENLPNGKQKLVWICPAYLGWKSMIERGYSHKCKEDYPTYKDVSMCEEWLLFSKFRAWWVENSVRGWQLDKDILHKGNLVYAPDKCVYVPSYVNGLLIDHAAARGNYPLGVSFHKQVNRFQSRVKLNGKQKHLGYFYTPEEAHREWQIGKVTAIKDAITRYTEDANHLGVFDQSIVTALEGRISSLQTDISNNRETLALH